VKPYKVLAPIPTSVPRDGLANLSYDETTNHITTSGFAYDAMGNQTSIVGQSTTAQRYQYDAANLIGVVARLSLRLDITV